MSGLRQTRPDGQGGMTEGGGRLESDQQWIERDEREWAEAERDIRRGRYHEATARDIRLALTRRYIAGEHDLEPNILRWASTGLTKAQEALHIVAGDICGECYGGGQVCAACGSAQRGMHPSKDIHDDYRDECPKKRAFLRQHTYITCPSCDGAGHLTGA